MNQQKVELRQYLLEVVDDPAGRQVLAVPGFARFTVLDNSACSPTLQIIQSTEVWS